MVLIKITAAKRLNENLKFTPPIGYKDLVDAATRVHFALGSNKLCGMCFGHELENGGSKGCCGQCSHLSSEGCELKTTGYAMHRCNLMRVLYPRDIQEKMQQLEAFYHRRTPTPNYTYFDRGYENDMRLVWSPRALARLKRVAQAYNALANRIERDKRSLDWGKLHLVGYVVGDSKA